MLNPFAIYAGIWHKVKIVLTLFWMVSQLSQNHLLNQFVFSPLMEMAALIIFFVSTHMSILREYQTQLNTHNLKM